MNDEAQMMCPKAPVVVDAPEPTFRDFESRGADANRAVIAALIASIVALFTILASPILRGEVYVADDLGEFHLPLRAFYAQQLARGESFDWCPDLYCGFYLTGEGQTGGYHPLHWLLYRALPLSLAFDLECWLSYPIMLVGLYVLFVRFRLRREAALFGAMVFTFGGFNLLHFVHPNAIAVIAHIPWLLFAIDISLRTNNLRFRLWAWAAVVLLTGSQLLLGYPQYVLYSQFVEIGYVLWIGFGNAPSSGRIYRGLASLAATSLLGVMIAAVQLLPTFDLLQHSVRSNTDESLATQGSLHPVNVLQLVAPYLLTNRVVGQNTHELGLYLGAVPLALAVWHVSVRAHRQRFRLLTMSGAGAAAFGLLWSFGQFGPLGWLEQHLPLANKFRLPCRAIVIFQLGVAVLAALGLANLLRIDRSQNQSTEAVHGRRRLWLLPFAAVAVAIIARAVWPQFTAAWPLILIGPTLFVIGIGFLSLAFAGKRWALSALVIFTAGDLAAYGMSESILHRTQKLSEFIEQTETPPGRAQFRVAMDLASGSESAPGQNGLRVGNRILLAGWKRADGYAGLEPARRLDYRQLAALQTAGVGWISEHAAENLVQTHGLPNSSTEGWIPIVNPLASVRLVTNTIVSNDPAIDIANIKDNAALVDEPLNLPGGPPGVATIATDRPGNLVVETHCSTAQLLVTNESFYPGWMASLDGVEAKLIRVNGDFMGVLAPAGRHEIRLEFRPESLRIGRLLSCFGLGLLVVTFALGCVVIRPSIE